MAGIRRSWDKNLYAAKASDRVDDSKGNSNVVIVEKREIRCLEGRDEATLNLDEKVGKVEVLRVLEGDKGPGYRCDVCDEVYKDSHTYMDHLNSARHQRAIGMNMKVQKASVDQVRERLEALKQEQKLKQGKGKLTNSGSISSSTMAARLLAMQQKSSTSGTSSSSNNSDVSAFASVSAIKKVRSRSDSDDVNETNGDSDDDRNGSHAKKAKHSDPDPSDLLATTTPTSSSSTYMGDPDDERDSDGRDGDAEIAAMMGFKQFGGSRKR